ncbi:MAG: lysylphosphatidylglycerol synthase domain-containing protein [Aequorivita sp.]
MAAFHKTNQYLLALAKVLVVVITFGYIFYRLRHNPEFDFSIFASNLMSKGFTTGYFLILFLILAATNWMFEIMKWRILVSTIESIDFKTALKQSLAALTVSLATPNRIGDYGAKALFFEREKRKRVLLLNFYSNGIQLLATIIFGTVGLFYFLLEYDVVYSTKAIIGLGIGIFIILILGYILWKKELLVKGFSIEKIFRYFQKFSNILKFKIFLLSILRYLVFSGMFYGLLLFFGSEIAFFTALALVFAMYLLVSIVPSIFIFDVVVRGGIAVWLFSFAGVSDLTVLSTVLVMWILNFVIPSIIGSYFVLSYQPVTQ